MKILIVDDEADVQTLFQQRFRKEIRSGELNLVFATNGFDALAVLDKNCQDIRLVLSDIKMPGMSGIGLATEITLERPQIKVLLMSGFTGGMLVLNEGWHFLSKPFIPSQLRTLIRGLISPGDHSKF